MVNRFTLSQFLEKYPTNEACLEEIKNLRWPDGITCSKCQKITKFYKVSNRTAYSCEFCGSQVYPLAGTIFDKTSTSLQMWFYAMFLMVQTRSGVSARQLMRETGVTYKTAWRMFTQIRKLMAETNPRLLEGVVEIDETFVGGKGFNRAARNRLNIEGDDKQVVMGMVQRGGKVYLKHIPNTGKWTLLKQIQENVDPKAKIYTDEWRGYTQLKYLGYDHDSVRHSTSEYMRGQVHTQNIENVWSHLKRGITGVYRIVSKKYLQTYADEYAFRYNNRQLGGDMFYLLLKQVPEVKMIREKKLA